MKNKAIFVLLLVISFVVTAGYAADNSTSTAPEIRVPKFWSPGHRPSAPEIAEIGKIRFLTGNDYPPFNFIDARGDLVGFNIDLAREICRALELECTIRTSDWGKLQGDIESGKGDAIIASMTLTSGNREKLDFTERYFTTPARFAVRREIGTHELSPKSLKGKKIGVIGNTAHAAFLQDFFRHSEIVFYKDRDALRKGLLDRDISYLFDDGISIMFWLDGQQADGCCAFAGGPYTESQYFGEGIAIAVAKGNTDLRDVLNHGLREVHESGKFFEIFLRHFPQSFY